MEAGALGCEIVISGKLRTERARFEKFRAGYFPRCGEPALRYMRKTEAHVQLKPGMFGVKVKIMPPDAKFPDKIQIVTELPPSLAEEKKPTEEGQIEKAETAEQIIVAETEKKSEPATEVPAQEPATPETKLPPTPEAAPAAEPVPSEQPAEKTAEDKPAEEKQ
jgi:small subunit ribosomal protein S3